MISDEKWILSFKMEWYPFINKKAILKIMCQFVIFPLYEE